MMLESVVTLMALAMGLHVWRTERELRRLHRESGSHERELYEIGIGVREVIGRAARPASYRVAAEMAESPQPVSRRAYCTDCRFQAEGVKGPVCMAKPAGNGQYFLVGSDITNKNHDCDHWDPAAEENEETG
jgi:hypothetical protein